MRPVPQSDLVDGMAAAVEQDDRPHAEELLRVANPVGEARGAASVPAAQTPDRLGRTGERRPVPGIRPVERGHHAKLPAHVGGRDGQTHSIGAGHQERVLVVRPAGQLLQCVDVHSSSLAISVSTCSRTSANTWLSGPVNSRSSSRVSRRAFL